MRRKGRALNNGEQEMLDIVSRYPDGGIHGHEICAMEGVSARATVYRRLHTLERLGYIWGAVVGDWPHQKKVYWPGSPTE